MAKYSTREKLRNVNPECAVFMPGQLHYSAPWMYLSPVTFNEWIHTKHFFAVFTWKQTKSSHLCILVMLMLPQFINVTVSPSENVSASAPSTKTRGPYHTGFRPTSGFWVTKEGVLVKTTTDRPAAGMHALCHLLLWPAGAIWVSRGPSPDRWCQWSWGRRPAREGAQPTALCFQTYASTGCRSMSLRPEPALPSEPPCCCSKGESKATPDQQLKITRRHRPHLHRKLWAFHVSEGKF